MDISSTEVLNSRRSESERFTLGLAAQTAVVIVLLMTGICNASAQPSRTAATSTVGYVDWALDAFSFTDNQGRPMQVYAVAGLDTDSQAYNRTIDGLKDPEQRKAYYVDLLRKVAVQEPFSDLDLVTTYARLAGSAVDYTSRSVTVGSVVLSLTEAYSEKGAYPGVWWRANLKYQQGVNLKARAANKMKSSLRGVRHGSLHNTQQAFTAVSLATSLLEAGSIARRIAAYYTFMTAVRTDLALARIAFVERHSAIQDPAFRAAIADVKTDLTGLGQDNWQSLYTELKMTLEANQDLRRDLGVAMMEAGISSLELATKMQSVAHAKFAAVVGKAVPWVWAGLVTYEVWSHATDENEALRRSALAATLYKSLESTTNRSTPVEAGLEVIEAAQYLFLEQLHDGIDNAWMSFWEFLIPSRGTTREQLEREMTDLTEQIAEARWARARHDREEATPWQERPAIVLILDSSGSMSDSDPERLRVDAARLAVDRMSDPMRAGLIDFDDEVQVLNPLTGLAGGRDALKRMAGRIDAEGGTNIGPAIAAAARMVRGQGRSSGVVLLTDGKGGYANEVEALVREGVPLYTIGLGTSINIELLSQVAEQSGGQYFKATTPDDLGPILDQILSEVTGGTTLIARNGVIRPDEVQTYEFAVDDQSEGITGSLIWPGSRLSLAFTDPSGREVNVRRSSGGTYDVVRHDAPRPGVWTARIRAHEVDASGEPFRLQISARTDLRPTIQELPVQLAPGELGSIRIGMPRAAVIDTALRVEAYYTRPDTQPQSIPVRIQEKSDSLLVQGTVRAGFAEGDYDLTVEVAGRTAAGRTFQRVVDRTFTVSGGQERLLNVIRVRGGFLEVEGARRFGLRPSIKVHILNTQSELIGRGVIISRIGDIATVEIRSLEGASVSAQASVVRLDEASWRGDVN